MVVSLMSQIHVVNTSCTFCGILLSDKDGLFYFDGIVQRIVGYCADGYMCRQRVQKKVDRPAADTPHQTITRDCPDEK